MERHEATAITTMLTSGYPNWKPTEQTLELYERLLAPLPAKFAEPAVMEILRSDCEFAPSIGAIITLAAQLALRECGAPALSAEEAWAEVREQMRTCGHHSRPSFSSPAVDLAVDALGWDNLCMSTNPETSRAHFYRTFNAFERKVTQQAIENLSNGRLALSHESPRLLTVSRGQESVN